ncbi:hypothetical protein LRS74_29120 [Streptomyces sp. LX-29]|nr:hypothetical protein LRS74_29120 [Streptomyces sp. LX-29]
MTVVGGGARARAVENQAYVLACGTAGPHGGVPQAGHSIVVDPGRRWWRDAGDARTRRGAAVTVGGGGERGERGQRSKAAASGG